MKNTTVIALVGKGGVGKTSISALTVRLLARKYPDKKILAIGRPEAAGCYNDEPKGRSRRRNASPAAGCPYLSLFY